MKENTIVQFVTFETTLDSEAFILQWEQYKRSVNSDVNVTLQQRVLNNGTFKYISQHRNPAGEFQFVFEKERRSSKSPEVEIRRKQAGGYSVLQLQSKNDPEADESKIFVFIVKPETDLDIFRHFSVHGKLNIYEAYYENCEFAYILEFFVKDEYAHDFIQQLKILTSFAEAGIYKECLAHA
jgi:hypothetical protein